MHQLTPYPFVSFLEVPRVAFRNPLRVILLRLENEVEVFKEEAFQLQSVSVFEKALQLFELFQEFGVVEADLRCHRFILLHAE